MCYNEEILLPFTVAHYKKQFPYCIITVYDNESTDNSINIATLLGCKIISYSTNKQMDEFELINIKNNCWKTINEGWIIICDMDEWLCINEIDLIEEEKSGTTIIKIQGLNVVSDSKKEDLSDLDIHNLKKCFIAPLYCKNICFLRKNIYEMNYMLGAHSCNPIGIIKHSNKFYYLKHMKYLGYNFLLKRWYDRKDRCKMSKEQNIINSYTSSQQMLKESFLNSMKKATIISPV